MKPFSRLVILLSIVFIITGLQASFGCAATEGLHNIREWRGLSGDSDTYFKARGVDPAWTLVISNQQIEFKTESTGYGIFIAPHAEPVKAADSNIKIYKLRTEAGEMEIEVFRVLCQLENSRERFPYAVTIGIREGRDSTFTYFTGCGQYVTDARLEARWTLDQIRSEKVTASQFNDTLPFLDLHARGNSFSGHSGCNTINGTIFSERSLLRFTHLVLSKRNCPNKPLEDELVNMLQFSTQYAIEGDKLILSNPGGQTLVFKRSGG